MFTKTIGKKCPDAQCALAGQLQDMGLVICPECGSELVPERVQNTRAQAALIVALIVVGGMTGLFGYGFVAKRLSPISTIEWVLGRIEVRPSFAPSDAGVWMGGRAVFFNDGEQVPAVLGDFLYQRRDGKRTSTFRTPLTASTRVRFDITAGVPSLYMLYRGDKRGELLFPGEPSASIPAGTTISIPGKDNLIRLIGGPGVEHFVIIAAKKPLSSLDDLRTRASLAPGDVDAVVAPLEADPDAYVLHVYIPHS